MVWGQGVLTSFSWAPVPNSPAWPVYQNWGPRDAQLWSYLWPSKYGAHCRHTHASPGGQGGSVCPTPKSGIVCAPSQREVTSSASQACRDRPALLPGVAPLTLPWRAAVRSGSIHEGPEPRNLIYSVMTKSCVFWPNRKLFSLLKS